MPTALTLTRVPQAISGTPGSLIRFQNLAPARCWVSELPYPLPGGAIQSAGYGAGAAAILQIPAGGNLYAFSESDGSAAQWSSYVPPVDNSGSALSPVPSDTAYRAKATAPKVLDTFTGAGSLGDHVADTGQTWTVVSGAAVLSSGALVADSVRAYSSAVLDSPDQDVSFSFAPGAPGPYILPLLRAGVLNSGYAPGIVATGASTFAPAVICYARNGTDRGAIASGANISGAHTISASVRGSGAAVTIRIWVDGALAVNFTDTDANRIVDAGSFGLLTANAGTTAIDNLLFRTCPREAIRLGAIGNSLLTTAGGNDPLTKMAAKLAALGYDVAATNNGVAGTTVDDWQPGSANMNAFVAANPNPTDVMFVFGTNEIKIANLATFTAAYFKTKARNILTYLAGLGHRSFLCDVPPVIPGAVNPSKEWDHRANARLGELMIAEGELVNGTSILFGGRGSYALFDWDRSRLLDGVHPDGTTGTPLQGDDWLVGYLRGRGPVPTLP